MAGSNPGSKQEKINIKKFYLAKVTTDELISLIHATPKYYSGVQECSITLEYIEDEAFAEGQKVVDDAMINGGTIDITLNQLSNEERAEILAYIERSTGSSVNVLTDSKEKSFFAVGYEVEFADGSIRYRWWYKTNPVLQSDSLSVTQSTNDVNRQSDIVRFNLLKTFYEIDKTSSGQKVKLFGKTAQTDDPNYDVEGDTWFDDVTPYNSVVPTP